MIITIYTQQLSHTSFQILGYIPILWLIAQGNLPSKETKLLHLFHLVSALCTITVCWLVEESYLQNGQFYTVLLKNMFFLNVCVLQSLFTMLAVIFNSEFCTQEYLFLIMIWLEIFKVHHYMWMTFTTAILVVKQHDSLSVALLLYCNWLLAECFLCQAFAVGYWWFVFITSDIDL